MIKVDSSSLIYLVKLGLFDLLLTSYKKIIISPTVKQEVIVRGKEKGKPDAIIIEQFLLQNKIELHQPKRLIENLNLGAGETEIISLSLQENCPCILDDIKAQKISIRLNVDLKSTPIFLLELLKSEQIDLQSYKSYVNDYGKIVNLSQNELWFYKELGNLIK